MPHVQKTGTAAASEELTSDVYDVLVLRRNNAEPLIVLRMRAPPRTGAAVNAPASLAQFQQAEQRQVDPLLAFVVRAEARALLWQAGELDLQTAVDALQEAAAASGLTAAAGQDAVQRILAAAGSDFHDDPIPRWER